MSWHGAWCTQAHGGRSAREEEEHRLWAPGQENPSHQSLAAAFAGMFSASTPSGELAAGLFLASSINNHSESRGVDGVLCPLFVLVK